MREKVTKVFEMNRLLIMFVDGVALDRSTTCSLNGSLNTVLFNIPWLLF